MRLQILSELLLSIVIILSVGATSRPLIAGSPSKTLVYKTVEGLKIHADVYEPKALGPRPVVAWYHGGALITGSRGDVPKQFIELSRKQSFVLVSFDYRLGPQAKLPEIISDLKDGLQWIRSEGPKLFNADSDKLVVAGASAGGYLAMMSGVAVAPLPTAIVSYYGFGDVDGPWITVPNERFLTGGRIRKSDAWAAVGDKVLTNTDVDSAKGRWKFFVYLKQTGLWTKTISGFDPGTERDDLTPYCPIRNLTSKYPPILMLHGTADQDVPHGKSVEMLKELQRVGGTCELITLVDGRHGLWGGDPAKVEHVLDRSMKFIVEKLTDQ